MQEHDIEQNFVEIDSAVHEPDPKLLEWAQQQWAQQPDEEFVDEVPVAEAIADAVPELPNAVEEELHDDELAVKSNPIMAQKLAEVLHTKYRAEKQRRGYFLTFDQHRELIARSKKSAEKAQLISGRIFRRGVDNSIIDVEPGYTKPVLGALSFQPTSKGVKYIGFLQAELAGGNAIKYTLIGTSRSNPQAKVRGYVTKVFLVGEKDQLESATSFMVVGSRDVFPVLVPLPVV